MHLLKEDAWHNFQADVNSVSTPRFKEVCFSSTALARAKRILYSLLSVEAPDGATCVVSDDDDRAQEETPVRKKKYLSGISMKK